MLSKGVSVNVCVLGGKAFAWSLIPLRTETASPSALHMGYLPIGLMRGVDEELRHHRPLGTQSAALNRVRFSWSLVGREKGNGANRRQSILRAEQTVCVGGW